MYYAVFVSHLLSSKGGGFDSRFHWEHVDLFSLPPGLWFSFFFFSVLLFLVWETGKLMAIYSSLFRVLNVVYESKCERVSMRAGILRFGQVEASVHGLK